MTENTVEEKVFHKEKKFKVVYSLHGYNKRTNHFHTGQVDNKIKIYKLEPTHDQIWYG